MRDPYLYSDSDVLKNKLGITDQELLEQAEADYSKKEYLEKIVFDSLE